MKISKQERTTAGRAAGTVVLALAMAVLGLGAWSAAEGGTVRPEHRAGALAPAGDDPEIEPVVTYAKEKETSPIAFRTVTRKTNKLKKGVTKVAQRGRAGLRVHVYRVTLEDGLEVDRELVNNVVKRKPVTKIVLKGTWKPKPKPEPSRSCDPNYSGCVPIAYDVDCAGGSGDGPRYVQGPVRVIGSDIYDLDADGDGWGCD